MRDQPERLRILYIAGAASMTAHGGIETYGRELIDGMARRGHTVELASIAPEDVYGDRRFQDHWPVPSLWRRYYFWRRFPHEDYRFHMILRRRVAAVRRRFVPDIVHALHLYPYGAVVGGGRPTLVSAYGLEVEPIPPVLGSVSAASAVHAISNYTAGLIAERIPIRKPVHVLTWGVRGRSIPGETATEFDLVTVARLVRRKNVDTILRALALLGNPSYAVIGDGPELLALKELARSLGLTKVVFFGAVDDERRRQILRGSRLFVMCPRQSPGDVEGLGLVYFEAAGAGLPVVAARSGGVPDAVGAAGLLVDEPEDAQIVARTVERALSKPCYARLLQEVAARQRTHSWDSFLGEFERLYAALTRNPRSRELQESWPTPDDPERTDSRRVQA